MTPEEQMAKEKAEALEKERAVADKERKRIYKLRSESPLDCNLEKLKVGDKFCGLSAFYKLNDLKLIEEGKTPPKFHGEIIEIEKRSFTPTTHIVNMKEVKWEDAEEIIWHSVKIKDNILKETYWTMAELVEKV